ncbi:MAG: hypothetical protein IKK10_04605 [Clostridia bacterium]|nr:hypothetical protein [Clostridia bacterium]
MKKKHIVIFSIATVLFLIFLVLIPILPKIGYTSPKNLLWLSPRVQCYKVYTILESNNIYYGVYRGREALTSDIIYEKDGRYYLYTKNTEPILWEHTGNNALVAIRSVEGKYTIEISHTAVENPINSVSDSLGTLFDHENIKRDLHTSQRWFAAIDTLPDDYYLDIDGEIIKLNP